LGAWPAIVGEHVAAHATPLELAGPTLVIATRSSAWSQQLYFLSATILEAVGALAAEAHVTRLTFRAGALRAPRARPFTRPTVERPALRPDEGGVPAPAVDASEALARLRERVQRGRRNAEHACERCGAVRAETSPEARLCAPCSGGSGMERIIAAERLLYFCPWLEPDAVREQIPDLAAGEVERIRRRLLQRWWLVLERARRVGRLSSSGSERSIASSYVLLQSRLPPDRITPAVVRNLLGPDLERLLWPSAPP